MTNFTNEKDFNTLLINGKELENNNIAVDFLISILDLINSINILMYTNYLKNNLTIRLELTKIIDVLNLIHKEFGLDMEKKEYRTSEHINLLELVKNHQSKIFNPNRQVVIYSKDACVARDCYIKALRLEHKFYCLKIEALYSSYVNYLVLYFDILSKIINEENGF